MILGNAQILTLDETVPTASALAVAGGKVLGGVDSREDAIASHAHERVDLQGATVVPGFVDAHVHFRAWALARTRLNLRQAASTADLADSVAAHAATLEPDAWVLGQGWHDHLLGASVDAGSLLDRAAAGRPCALVSKDGHALAVNSAALRTLAMDPAAIDSERGGLVEWSPDGRFLGLLRETAAWAVRRRLPTDDLSTATLAGAMREASRRGVTSLHDMDGAAGLRSWRQLERERGLTVRVWQHLLEEDLAHAAALGIDQGFGSERLHIGGLKVFVDGTISSGTAWLHEAELPIPGASTRSGVIITDAPRLTSLAREAAAAGLPLVSHAIGDAAVTAVLDALEASEADWRGLAMRPRIEHAQLMRPADIARAARLGVALSTQPTHLVEDRDTADTRWGASRTPHAFALRSMVDAGCGVLLGSDAPIEDLHPLAAFHAAVTRDGGAHGLAPARGAWHPEQSLDAETALRACTSWPADATGVSSWLGRLTPGHQADLVVLSDNPLRTPPGEIKVVATMVGGRWTWGAANLSR